jgi:hypothetical protein
MGYTHNTNKVSGFNLIVVVKYVNKSEPK